MRRRSNLGAVQAAAKNLVRALVVGLVISVAAAGSVAPVSATPAPPQTSAPDVPDECPPPSETVAVFVGRVEAKDWRSARFSVQQVRSGSLDGFAVGALVDVDFFEDVRFLEIGERYVVGAGRDPLTRRLVSKVRESELRFGGSQVVALDQLDCPTVVDPVRTLDVDGTPVESGVLTPLYGEGRALLRAILLPLVWVFGALLALTGLKVLLVWLIKRLSVGRTPTPTPLRRQHTR